MLPFSKRKKADEIELEDADLVVLEEAPIEVDVAELEVASDVTEADLELIEERPQLPRVSTPSKASLRRIKTPRSLFEDDVANECLESIAAATSQTRPARLSDSFPASIVPLAPRLPHFDSSIDELLADAPLPQFELSDTDETTRRPALSSSSLPMAIARDSVPGVMLAPPMSVSSLPTPVFSRTSSSSSANLSAASSIAPVSMNASPESSRGPEPTVILVRQPPKAAWVVAAALLGAACALVGMRAVTKQADAPQTSVVAAPPPPVTTEAAQASPPSPPATVRFNDDQAVAVIAAPTTATVSSAPALAPAPAPAPAPKPVVTTASSKAAPKPAASLGPKLPDGSVALTKPSASSPARTAQSEPAPALAPAPAPAPAPTTKRKLTPEQELAEAQLKASMK